jgi:hypothetical protein
MITQTGNESAEAVRNLVMRYAHCVDSKDCEGFGALFTADATLGDDNFSYRTAAEIRSVPKSMHVYAKTFHAVWNVLTDLSDNEGVGEVYCAAHHLIPQSTGKFIDLVMYIIYRDFYVRRSGTWLFQKRHITVEFTEHRAAELFELTPELERLRHAT